MSPEKIDKHCSIYCIENDIPIIGTGRKPEEVIFGGYLLIVYPGEWDPKIDLQEGILSEVYRLILEHTQSHNIFYRHQAVKKGNLNASLDDSYIYFILHRWQKQVREEYKVPISHWKKSLKDILVGLDTQDLITSKIKRDFLVCTHAQRDICCGRYGAPLYNTLISERSEETNSNSGSSVQVWKSSHITGHRAAPVLLDLPRGIYWGYMNHEMAEKVLKQESLSDEEIRYHYRGATDLTPQQQLVDREGFIKYGWTWFDVVPKTRESHENGVHNIQIIRGHLAIQQFVDSTPQIFEIGETRCGYTKHATVYNLQLSDQ